MSSVRFSTSTCTYVLKLYLYRGSIHRTKACLTWILFNFCEILIFSDQCSWGFLLSLYDVASLGNGSSNFPDSALVSKMSKAHWRGVLSQKNGYVFSILVIYIQLPNFLNVIISDFYSGGAQFENNLGCRIIWTRFPNIFHSVQEAVGIVPELWLPPSRSFPI